MELKDTIRSIPNFPEPGIIFRDITTLLKDGQALSAAITAMEETLRGVEFDHVVGPESRGFIFGVPLAVALKKGFIPARKPGKLPCATVSKSYDLEYGSNTIEVHADAIKPGDKIVLVDDLLATGGTARALCDLVEEMGGKVVKAIFLIELADLNGRQKLSGLDVSSVVVY